MANDVQSITITMHPNAVASHFGAAAEFWEHRAKLLQNALAIETEKVQELSAQIAAMIEAGKDKPNGN